MCSRNLEFLIITIVIVLFIPLLISNLALSYIDKPKFKINSIYREFTKKTLKNNITNVITNDLLLNKLNNNLELMIDIVTEDTYKEVFNNTELYSYDGFLNNINNLTYHYYSNKTGIDKLFYNNFYHELKDVTKIYFYSIKNNYYLKKDNNQSNYKDIYQLIIDSWVNKKMDNEFTKLSDNLSYLLQNNTNFQYANKDFNCMLIFNIDECPIDLYKYNVNVKLNVIDRFSNKYNYYNNKNVYECCNH